MKFDNRTSPRLRLKRGAPATTRYGGVEIVDFSPLGIGICSDFPIDVHNPVWLEFKWGTTPVRLECDVRSCVHSRADGNYRTGLSIRAGMHSAAMYKLLVEKELAKLNAAKPASAF
jgi:hypothetical protein